MTTLIARRLEDGGTRFIVLAVILRAQPLPRSPLTRIVPVPFEGRSRGRAWTWFIYEIPVSDD